MFYCDECAKANKYPIVANENEKSVGPCEVCEKVLPCNDVHHDMLDLGPVTLYHFQKSEFLKPDKKSFQAPKSHYRIVGFDLKRVFGDDAIVIVPVNYLNDIKEKADASKQIASLRGKVQNTEGSEQVYYLFNEKGYLEKINP